MINIDGWAGMEKFELEALWWLREAGQLILTNKYSYLNDKAGSTQIQKMRKV